MNGPPAELLEKICFLIHRGCVEIRQFIGEGRPEQAFALADAIEHIPGYLPSWKDEYLAIIADSFQRYQAKYHNKAFDYYGILLSDASTFQHELGRWRGDR
ncbi:hypothetical protein [Tuwongella immobilis]|uniref:Uncharacterized protein n=1 Tax=Tuwongella immobilis TaxID=692036 RepID=A0A6C2YKK2_9BACT|nr:hypothetical protein [Tuwongella immobilis]VIP01831.1 unnamed protein product [Tuwongella immobilis]VTR99581.1 unnamed protein product [Tuwongella immobilis]